MHPLSFSLSLPSGLRTGGEKKRKKKGVLTCRRVVLTSAVLERRGGGGGSGRGKQGRESDKEEERGIGGGGRRTERGQEGGRGGDIRRRKSGVKGWVREGGRKTETGGGREGEAANVCVLLFFSLSFFPPIASSSSITRHPDRAGNWTWTSLPLSFPFLFLRLSLPRGSTPQREPWGPEIADDKIAAAFHSAQGYPTLPWQPKREAFKGVCLLKRVCIFQRRSPSFCVRFLFRPSGRPSSCRFSVGWTGVTPGMTHTHTHTQKNTYTHVCMGCGGKLPGMKVWNSVLVKIMESSYPTKIKVKHTHTLSLSLSHTCTHTRPQTDSRNCSCSGGFLTQVPRPVSCRDLNHCCFTVW